MADFIYTEEDMQIARKAVDQANKQYENALALIWAIAMQNGGTLQIDQRLLMDAPNKGNILSTWNHPTDLLFCVKASRPAKHNQPTGVFSVVLPSSQQCQHINTTDDKLYCYDCRRVIVSNFRHRAGKEG